MKILEAIHERTAGIDIHQKTAVVSALIEQKNGEVEIITQEFGTSKKRLQDLAKWLLELKVDLCVIESTGVYWKPVHRVLEMAGLTLAVVNARHVKNVPGRKTDIKDSQWLGSLGRYGLLKASFVPDEDLQQIRLITRYRNKLVGMLASEKNRMHKMLVDAGVHLANVVSDINGISAQAIIEGLLNDVAIEEILKQLKGSLKGKATAIREVLEEITLSKRHRFVLSEIRGHMRELEKRLAGVTAEIFEAMKPYEQQWKLLQTIPGIDAVGAAMLIAEMGVNMERFGSEEEFCSWSGMCPGNHESAGKSKSGKRRKGNAVIRKVLCELSNGAIRTKSQFKSKYQTLVIRRGHKRAVVAIGHKIQRVIYCVLKKGQPYRDPGIDYQGLVVKKNAPRWMRALEEFGYLPKPATQFA